MKKFKNIFHKRRMAHDFILNGVDELKDGKYFNVNKQAENVFLVGENVSDMNLDKRAVNP